MKQGILKQILLYDYRYIFGYGLLIGVAIYAAMWRLGSLVPGLGFYEAEYTSSLTSWQSIIENPLFWPHKALTLLSQTYIGYSEFSLRLPSVFISLIAISAFFGFIKGRFKARIAIIAVGLLATSSWWLHSARLARPEILIPTMIFVLMHVSRKTYESRKPAWLILLAILAAISLYIPLMVYVVLIGCITTISLIKKYRGDGNQRWVTIGWIVMGIFTLPLLVSIGFNPSLLKPIFGIPESWPGLLEIGSNFTNGISQLFWQSSDNFWPLRLGSLPLLDLFTSVMFALGVWYLDQEISRSLAHFVLLGFGVLLVLTSFSSEPWVNLILIPFVYLLVSAGVVMLFSQWYEIFPRNPVARMTAFIPTLVLLGSVIWYHHHRYFVAWPNSPEIIEEFPPLSSDLRTAVEVAPSGTFLLIEENEIGIAQTTTFGYPNLIITSVGSSITGQTNLIISALAYADLDPEVRLGADDKLTPVQTEYSTYPVSIYHTLE